MTSHTLSDSVFSSAVQLRLEIDGESLSVCAVGPDRFVLAQAQSLTTPHAVLLVTIDGETHASSIRIHPSAEPAREYTYIRSS